MTLSTAAVLGTGMMGPGIARTLQHAGLDVMLVSRTPERAEHVRKETGIETTHDLTEACAGAELVIESVPEDLALKQALFAELERITPAGAILASNTSALPITEIARACQDPTRVITAHFINPPDLVPLVEIVLGERTNPHHAETLRALFLKAGKKPVVLKQDLPGQLTNRLQMALWREALYLIEIGAISAEDLNTAVMYGMGRRFPGYGPVDHMECVGLDMVRAVMTTVLPHLSNTTTPPKILEVHETLRETTTPERKRELIATRNAWLAKLLEQNF